MTDETNNVVPLHTGREAKLAHIRSKLPVQLCTYCGEYVCRTTGSDVWAHPECLVAKGKDFIDSGEADHVLFVVHRGNGRTETWDIAYLRKLQARAEKVR